MDEWIVFVIYRDEWMVFGYLRMNGWFLDI